MKLISLNVWGGRLYEPLIDFLKKYKQDVDVFCFQEMYHKAEKKTYNAQWADDRIQNNLFEQLKPVLNSHNSFFYPHFEDFWGLSMFINKNVPLLKEGDFFVHQTASVEDERRGATSKNVQYASLEYNGKHINIVNFHGLWNGQGKGDSETRIAQSKNIVEFLKSLTGEIVLCGDFNLKPDTQSLQILEDFGLRNLIKEYGITSTRTSFYTKEERFADYMLVSKGIDIKTFEVLPDEISDHSAVYLEFN